MTADSYDFEPEDKAISQHITSGIVNSGIIQAVKIICQFASLIVLSRLISPADFGLIAMVSPVYSFIIIFHDLGLSQATIQKTGLRHEEVNAFFWLNIAMGIILATITVIISPLVEWYYNEPRAVALTMAMGALILIGVTGNQHGTLLRRRMQFKSLALIDIAGSVSSLCVSILLALVLDKGYWALFGGMAAAILVPVAGAWLASSWRPTFPRQVKGLSEMLRFGAGITSGNFTAFIAGNTDNILIGHRWGDLELGLYDRAYKLLLFPLQRITLPLSGTMIPLLSRLKDQPEKYRSVIQNSLEQMLFAIWPGILWAVLLSDRLIPTVLGERWTDAVSIFIPLGLASLMQVLNSSPYWIFLSLGRGGDYARWGIANALTSVGAFLIGLPYGALGVAIAYAASEYIRTPFLWWYALRRSPVIISDMMGALFPQVASAVVTTLMLMYFRNIAQGAPLPVLAAGLILSYTVFALVMALFPHGRKILSQTAAFAGNLLAHFYPERGKKA